MRTSALFPLPLTAFEYYYWCDDRAEYPTAFPFELTFSGKLQRRPLLAALEVAFRRHPLLGARIEDRNGKPCWIQGDGRQPPIDWDEEPAPMHHPDGQRIDLRKSCGVRIWVRAASEATRVRLQFHHACCDGLGAARFIEDLLVSYHAEVKGLDAADLLPSLDAEQLRARGGFLGPAPRRNLYRTFYDAWVTAREWWKLLAFHPSPLAAPAPAALPAESGLPILAFATRVLEADQARGLRQAASARGATLNDLLLCELFQLVRDWNCDHGEQNGRLRVNVPTNLRGRADHCLPAANRLSFAFLTRKASQCGDGQKLLAGIRKETEQIKRQWLSLYFIGGLALVQGIPGVVPWFLRQRRCFSTIVLSNAGRIFARTPLPRRDGRLVCGDAVLNCVTGAPPIRPLTRAAIAVSHYAGRMAISLRCDPQLFTMEQTDQFLSQYVERLSRRLRKS